MKFAAVLVLLTVAGARSSTAQTTTAPPKNVTVQIEGYVVSGMNGSPAVYVIDEIAGPFGPIGKIPQYSPFILTFTFPFNPENTKATTFENCSGGVHYYSQTTYSQTTAGLSGPGTATLTIGSGSFTFGDGSYGQDSLYFRALLYAVGTQCSRTSEAGFRVNVGYNDTKYSGTSTLSQNFFAAASNDPLTSDAEWDFPASMVPVPLAASAIGFSIGINGRGNPKNGLVASGVLMPQTFLVPSVNSQ
jgi:hypothetical protein